MSHWVHNDATCWDQGHRWRRTRSGGEDGIHSEALNPSSIKVAGVSIPKPLEVTESSSAWFTDLRNTYKFFFSPKDTFLPAISSLLKHRTNWLSLLLKKYFYLPPPFQGIESKYFPTYHCCLQGILWPVSYFLPSDRLQLLFPPLCFTGTSPSKSLAYLIPSQHLLLREPRLTQVVPGMVQDNNL